VDLKPDFAAARVNLGEALANAGKLDEAVVELRRALATDQGQAPAHYALGLVLKRQGNLGSAIQEWRRALELDRQSAEAHSSLGDALYEQGLTTEALGEWRAEIELRPNDSATLRKTAWTLATWPDAAVRNGEDAMAFAVRANQLTGGHDARTLDTLAAAYAEKGDFDYAQYVANRARAAALLENRAALAEQIRTHQALYLAHQPCRSRDTLGQE
jgi:tetratricopeptide (TPR) repeat protein